jgi:hypothetical protein
MTPAELVSALPDALRFGPSVLNMGQGDSEPVRQAIAQSLSAIVAPTDQLRYAIQIGPGFGRVPHSDMLTGKLVWMLVASSALIELTAEMTRDEGPPALRVTTHRTPLDDVLRSGLEHAIVHGHALHAAVVLGSKDRSRRISSREVAATNEAAGVEILTGFVQALIGAVPAAADGAGVQAPGR